MKILVQGDLYMKVEVLQACVENALADLGLSLEFETITIETVVLDVPLPAPEEGKSQDTWNPASGSGSKVYEFHGPIDLLVEPIRAADFMVMHTAAVTQQVLEAARGLKAIACGRGGPVNIDLEAVTRFGIPVVHAPGRNARAVAEFIMGLILAYDRHIISGWDGIRHGLWRQGLFQYHLASPGLAGAVMGMVGFGRVGRILAPLAAAFGLRLLACDPYVDKQAVAQYGAEKVDSLDALIPQSDFVVILARYTPETRHIIGARELALMKPTACLVNAARGPLLDYEALYPALKEHRIKGALLDVFATEPLNAGNPLLDLDNVLLTPHIAGATQESVLCAGQMMSADLRRIILGERPVNCINPQVLDAPRRWDPQSLRQP